MKIISADDLISLLPQPYLQSFKEMPIQRLITSSEFSSSPEAHQNLLKYMHGQIKSRSAERARKYADKPKQ